jgi:RNA polymerase sigma-70 factor (ECF subfamily)
VLVSDDASTEACSAGTANRARKRNDGPRSSIVPQWRGPVPSVAELVELARANDAAAWETLYHVTYPRLLAFARRRLDEDSAQEAVSETLARAVTGIGCFVWKSPEGFMAWLFGILRHIIIDTHRSRARSADLRSCVDVCTDLDPLERVLSDEELRAVRTAFGRLSGDDRQLLELRVVSGLCYEDIAFMLNKRPSAVRTAQCRALRRLRRLLLAAGGAPG